MPKQLTCLTIFASGTTETDAEKGALAKIVEDLSGVLEKTHKITLRTVMWPNYFRPGVGADPQSVINEQVGAECDVYIGILGTRFGQPTPRAGSGTEEEFNTALARFQQDPTSVRVLFYFKRSQSDPFAIDLEQLQRVLRFRESLSPKGVLYRDFTDTATFAENVRGHLHHLIVDEWDAKRWRTKDRNPTRQEIDSSASVVISTGTSQLMNLASGFENLIEREEGDGDGDFGLIETMQQVESASNDLKVVLERMADHTQSLSRNLQNRTVEANSLTELALLPPNVSRGNHEYMSRARDLADQAAADVDGFAAKMTADIQVFAEMSSRLFRCVDQAQVIRKEFAVPPEQLDEEHRAIQQLIDNIATSQAEVADFQAIVARLPALTGKVKKARRRAAVVLGELIAALQLTQQRGRELLALATEKQA